MIGGGKKGTPAPRGFKIVARKGKGTKDLYKIRRAQSGEMCGAYQVCLLVGYLAILRGKDESMPSHVDLA